MTFQAYEPRSDITIKSSTLFSLLKNAFKFMLCTYDTGFVVVVVVAELVVSFAYNNIFHPLEKNEM